MLWLGSLSVESSKACTSCLEVLWLRQGAVAVAAAMLGLVSIHQGSGSPVVVECWEEQQLG